MENQMKFYLNPTVALYQSNQCKIPKIKTHSTNEANEASNRNFMAYKYSYCCNRTMMNQNYFGDRPLFILVEMSQQSPNEWS